MRPVGIPDTFLHGWPGAAIIDIGVSKDQKAQDIHELQGVVDVIRGGPLDGCPRTQVRIELEPGDLEALHENPHLWIAFMGVAGPIYPFSITVEEEPNQPSASLELEQGLRKYARKLREPERHERYNMTPAEIATAVGIAEALEKLLEETVGG